LRRADPERASERFEVSLRLDPLSADRWCMLGFQGVACLAQPRFPDVVALSRQSIQLRPQRPMPHAVLAGNLAHVGELAAAREAIARHDALTSVRIRDWAARNWLPDVKTVILEGLDLAEGNGPDVPD